MALPALPKIGMLTLLGFVSSLDILEPLRPHVLPLTLLGRIRFSSVEARFANTLAVFVCLVAAAV